MSCCKSNWINGYLFHEPTCKNAKPDAALIAAAPDMLVMLKIIQCDLRMTDPREAKLRDEIQKVIDKAEPR